MRPCALWDVATGQELRRFNGHAAAIWDVNSALMGHYVVSGSQDTTVIIWELNSGEQLRVFEAGEAMIQGVVFTPDSQRLPFVSADGALRVWQPVLNLNELRSWTQSDRYIRELSCSEQELYRLSSNCDPEE